ncbi:hypothetical protein KY385_00590 [Candidatus Parcubacteria bacterium]|nr:hypothetical protein [Candidatus Parcubacteria bacterium]
MSKQPSDLDNRIDNFMARKARQHPDLRLTIREEDLEVNNVRGAIK